ncbi:tRNA-splicing endonuclease subunit Sen2 [Lucilia cuprina]|uniref:tRNA-splicing endonuclease subunit Sen2 n=1 Tax=Lucilia cuprina TaxID=7375 RepID=UPI001F0576F6|nr:tRNA-splicing endonuclease subunit Sen2 [Lucilia cuprina]
MFFTPHLKRKKGSNNKWQINPFPNTDSNKQYEGIFTGISVEVYTKVDIIAIYDNGFYGKGSQSRSIPKVVIQSQNSVTAMTKEHEVEETLSLSLEEAFFLSYYLKVLKIYDFDKKEMEYQRFLQQSLKVNKLFVESFASYVYLKSKGWVVKSGLKFGGNYLIYRKGPRFYHASFVVVINTPSDTEHLNSKNIKGLQRIAETSDKDVLILEVHKPSNFQFASLESISAVEISEMIIRRFNCTSYVQNQNTIK